MVMINILEILKKNFPKNFNLKGTKIVLDCANGACYKAAPKIVKRTWSKSYFSRLNLMVLILTKCGSTYPSKYKISCKKK